MEQNRANAYICRFAVPFFLMVTGWYIRRDSDEETFKAAIA